MIRTALHYAFTLTVLYLVVANATNSGTLIKDGSAGVSSVEKTFQGR